MALLRWLGRNLSTMLLSLVLALIVWGSAVTSADPDQERIFPVPIEIIGQEPDVEILEEIPEVLSITLFAPVSNLDVLSSENSALRAWIDLSGLTRGTHTLEVQYLLPGDIRPLRLVQVSPKVVEVTLEKLISKTMPIEREVLGEPGLGYQLGGITWSAEEVTVSGRSADVEKVVRVEASLDISGTKEDVQRSINLRPLNENGSIVSGIALNPERINVTQTVTLQGGYRNMVVRVVTTGQVAEGYRQTNITVSPPNILVFSPDVAMIEGLPGFVETEELDISGASDDIETVLSLNLPADVSVIGDPNVLVQMGIAAINGSLSLSLPVELIGVLPGLAASVAPDVIEVIVFGPIPLLPSLTDVDVRVVVDLSGLEEGVYQLTPQVIILPDQVQLQVISPEEVEVTIISAELITPTPSPTPIP
jgi:YbbR domain-containing protein